MYETIKRSSTISTERRILIDEVNTSEKFVTGKDSFQKNYRVTFDFHDPVLAIPVQGEMWIISQYENEWRLERRVDTGTETIAASDLAPGDRRLEAQNDLHLNADATVNVNATDEVTVDTSLFTVTPSVTASIVSGGNVVVSSVLDTLISATGPLNLNGSVVNINGVDINTKINDVLTSSVILAPTTSARNVIVPTIDAIPLTVKNFAGGAANTFEAFGTGGTRTVFISSAGGITATGVITSPTINASTTLQVAGSPIASTNLSDTALLARLASPTFTGVPAAPTAAVDTNTTQIATTAFVVAQASSATPIIDGTGTVGTSLRYARQDHIHPTDTTRAPLASPTFTGVPAAPTAAVDTSTTQLATTAFVIAQSASATPLMDGTAAVGTSTRFARGDHRHPTDTSLAPLASPTLTGVPAAPTATTGTNTTQLATTAFVRADANELTKLGTTFTTSPRTGAKFTFVSGAEVVSFTYNGSNWISDPMWHGMLETTKFWSASSTEVGIPITIPILQTLSGGGTKIQFYLTARGTHTSGNAGHSLSLSVRVYGWTSGTGTGSGDAVYINDYVGLVWLGNSGAVGYRASSAWVDGPANTGAYDGYRILLLGSEAAGVSAAVYEATVGIRFIR